MLRGLGVDCGCGRRRGAGASTRGKRTRDSVDLEKLVDASLWISNALQRKPVSARRRADRCWRRRRGRRCRAWRRCETLVRSVRLSFSSQFLVVADALADDAAGVDVALAAALLADAALDALAAALASFFCALARRATMAVVTRADGRRRRCAAYCK